MLEGDWRDLCIYDQATACSQILAKASKISPLSKARASNLYLLSGLHGPAVTTTLLLNLGALLYNKLRHFVPGLKNECPLCHDGPFEIGRASWRERVCQSV